LLDRVERPDANYGLYWATEAGLACFGLERFGVWREPSEGIEHAWLVGEMGVRLEQGLSGRDVEHGRSGWDVLSAREVVAIEADSGKQFASVRVDGGGHGRVHVPALTLVSPTERIVPVEVQPLLATEADLVAVCRGWASADHVDRVYWLATPGPLRAVQRRVREAGRTERLAVLSVEQVGSLVVSEQTREKGGQR
jgi:hypothetical protein